MQLYWITTEQIRLLDGDEIVQITRSWKQSFWAGGAHQRLSWENLQQRDEVVSISQVLVQVSDVSLGLGDTGGHMSFLEGSLLICSQHQWGIKQDYSQNRSFFRHRHTNTAQKKNFPGRSNTPESRVNIYCCFSSMKFTFQSFSLS